MKKTAKKRTPKLPAGEALQENSKKLAAYHSPASPDILIYHIDTGAKRAIGTVTLNKHADVRAFANSIAEAINTYEDLREVLGGMIYALELCLESKLLTWEAEQEASPVVERAKRILSGSNSAGMKILPDISSLPLVASIR